MTRSPSTDNPVVVIGAGPHGLAAVAHLRDAGVPTVAFGEPLSFWKDTMPNGMLLRSATWATNISSPRDELSLSRWSREHARELPRDLPLAWFIEYGTWFQDRVVPDVDRRVVAEVAGRNGGFSVRLDDGEEVEASRVIVAAGIGPFANKPSVFDGSFDGQVTHTSASPPLESFSGKSVIVIGSGQSALESAALLADANAARVEVLARAPRIYWLNHGWIGERAANETPLPPPSASPAAASAPSWRARKGLYWHDAPTDLGGHLTSWLGAAPDVLRHMPRGPRWSLTYHCVKPAGADWLPDRLRAVKFSLARTVTAADRREGQVRVQLDDGTHRLVDHVLLGTGYTVDVRRYGFLSPELVGGLRLVDGSPALGRGLESSVPGLHFVGATATETFGPTMRFVVGTAYTAPAVAQHVLGRSRPLFRWAF
jgi:pyruvate/2-oxoglutarate dehydrogenase complex dihydrolipoamide dehydrogenase (E3) component